MDTDLLFKTEPYAHQKHCIVNYGMKEYFALLAEQGTGKTWIIINNAFNLWRKGLCDGLLVLAPSGVHIKWIMKEFPKHGFDDWNYKAIWWTANHTSKYLEQLKEFNKQERTPRFKVMAFNWEACQNERGREAMMKFITSLKMPMIACDESSAMKDPSGQRAKFLEKIKVYSAFRRIMDGTPVNNSPFDLFSQYRFLNPQILKTKSYREFQTQYAIIHPPQSHLIQHIVAKKVQLSDKDKMNVHKSLNEIKAILYKNGRDYYIYQYEKIVMLYDSNDYTEMIASLIELKNSFPPGTNPNKINCERHIDFVAGIIGGFDAKWQVALSPNRIPIIVQKGAGGKPKYKNLAELTELIAPYSFRVMKKDCLDLPETFDESVYIEMTPEQWKIYKKADEELLLEFKGIETPHSRLVRKIKLSQITSGYYLHALSDKQPVRIDGGNPKMDRLMERIEADLNEEKQSIIWARYTTQIKDIRDEIRKRLGVDTVEYYGEVKKNQRPENIDLFESGQVPVFIGNPQAGGTGIDLVASHRVHYFADSYSYRNKTQSKDRSHRIGQIHDVTYYNYIALGTVDEEIDDVQDFKGETADTILSPLAFRDIDK